MNRRDLIKLLAIVAVLAAVVLLVNRIDSAQGAAETDIVSEQSK